MATEDTSITDYDRSQSETRRLRTNLPTAAAASGAGTSPPAPVVASTNYDSKGRITWGTGTSTAAGNQVTVTFSRAYAKAPVVMLTPSNTATAQLNPCVLSVGVSSFIIGLGAAPAASQANTVYSVDYLVVPV